MGTVRDLRPVECDRPDCVAARDRLERAVVALANLHERCRSVWTESGEYAKTPFYVEIIALIGETHDEAGRDAEDETYPSA